MVSKLQLGINKRQAMCNLYLSEIALLCRFLSDLDEDLNSGDKSLDDILPRGNVQSNPPPLRSFGSFTSSSVTRDRNGVSSSTFFQSSHLFRAKHE